MKKIAIILLFTAIFSVESFGQVLGNPIYNWDFANGIPSSWIAGISSTNNIAQWEYRGPNTVPDSNVGARGSCSGIAQPLQSGTRANGFVIFDSNYWDDAGTACGTGFGTGIDPAPHTAWLITEPLDLSTLTGAVLTFQQQYRVFQGSTKVQISVDGGIIWTDIITNSGPQSPNVEWKSVNVSSYVQGETSVRFRFVFQGTYYWWLLDDITIYEPNQNDVMLSSKSYTLNSGPNSTAELLDLEYDRYPLLIIPPFNFRGKCTNVGVNAQTNTNLRTRIVLDGITETFNSTSIPLTVPANTIQNMSITPEYTNPSTIGNYKIYYSLEQDQIDQTPANNIDSLDYSITQYTYARDEKKMVNTYTPSATYDPYIMEAGCFYQAFKPNTFCHSLQVAVAEGTQIGAGLRGYIYNQAMDTILTVTADAYVNAANLNAVGDEKMITLQMLSPFQLAVDSIYFVALTEIDSTQTVVVARSGMSPGESSLIRFKAVNATFVSSTIPMVRMNIFSDIAQPGCNDAGASNYSPLASINDGSCLYPGCSNPAADNYAPTANFDDGTCVVGGCLDPLAANYNSTVNYDNGSCLYPGCTDPIALNFDPNSNFDNGQCEYLYTSISVNTLTGCAPLNFTLQNNNEIDGNSACNYTLNGDIINSQCSAQFEYTIDSPGLYELVYTYNYNNAVADTTILINVIANPASPIITYDNENYLLSCTNCGTDQYSWFYENQALSVSQNSNLDITSNGNFVNGNYSLYLENLTGCVTLSEPFLLLQPLFVTNTNSACAPLTITATDLSLLPSGTSCTINFGDGQGSQNFQGAVQHEYTVPGEYPITMECTLSGVVGNYIIPVNVFPVISPILIHNVEVSTVECTNCDLFEEVTWLIDGATIIGSTSQPDDGVVYSLTGITANGCGATTMLVMTSTNDITMDQVQLFPIPANDVLQILTNSKNTFQIRIYDSFGRLQEFNSKSRENMLEVNTSLFANGLYIFQLQSANSTSMHKVLVQH